MPFVPWLGHHYVLHVGLAFSLLLEHKLYVALVDCFIVC
jgi:lipoprotein signal peptidase